MSDSPLMLGAHVCGSMPLTVVNCRRWRAKGCSPRCAARPSGCTLMQCAECPVRLPIIGSVRLRGLGDIVAWAVFFLFLRRLDIAERVGRLLDRRRRPDATRAASQPNRGCGGCKARQQALNRALPLR